MPAFNAPGAPAPVRMCNRMYRHASCRCLFMRLFALALLGLLASSARADTENVQASTKVLDFKVPRPPASATAGGTAGFPGALDLDGDGQVSKAEAAGNAKVTLGFDRADRNRNGRVSSAEWDRYEKWQERRAKAREARLAKAKESASAGATRSKPPPRPARSAP